MPTSVMSTMTMEAEPTATAAKSSAERCPAITASMVPVAMMARLATKIGPASLAIAAKPTSGSGVFLLEVSVVFIVHSKRRVAATSLGADCSSC